MPALNLGMISSRHTTIEAQGNKSLVLGLLENQQVYHQMLNTPSILSIQVNKIRVAYIPQVTQT